METYTFWREREAQFSKLAKREGSKRLHAIRADDVDVHAVLDEFSDRTFGAIANPAALPDSVYGYARMTARAGRIQLDGEQFDRWYLSGGPNDELARAGLHNDFKAEAMMAAVGADAVPASTTDQAALEAWLELIRRSRSPENPSRHVIQSLAHASAEACNQLASRAYRNGRAAAQIDAAPGSSRDKQLAVAVSQAPELDRIVDTPMAAVTEGERRRHLLETFKQITGVRVEAHIYRAAKVHRPDWRKWKKDTLPPGSVITKRIEDFLKEMKPPVRAED